MNDGYDQMGKKNGQKQKQVLFVDHVILKIIRQERMYLILKLHYQVHV